MNKETEITDNGLPKVLSQIITDNVYFLKQRHRVPQTSIANAMHIPQSTLNLKLGGKVRWNVDDLAYLSAFFNVSVAYLVTNNVTMPSDHYQLRTQYAVDNAIPSQELAGAAGPRYIVRPDDGADEGGCRRSRLGRDHGTAAKTASATGRFQGASGGTRTHTAQILRLLPLPIGIRGRAKAL